MSGRNYLCGSVKRKLKKQRDEQQKKLAGSMLKYFETTSALSSSPLKDTEDNDDSNNTDSNVSQDDPVPCDNPTPEIFVQNGKKNIEDDICYEGDPALWCKIDEKMIDFFLSKPPNQNLHILPETEREFGSDKVKRKLTEGHFYRLKQNSEKVLRKWMVLSPSTKNLYCWVCKLMMSNSNSSSNQLVTGFNDWKHASTRLSEHENSIHHRQAVLQMSQRMDVACRIDSSMMDQYNEESNYWKAVLKRVVAVIKFLSQRGLPFFGSNETIGSKLNGNFLGCMELIAQFDPFLASHLEKYGNPGSGKVSYLSSTIINEFISIMSKRVLKHIVSEVLTSKYFSIIVDSTPDITHVDQLCFILRYVVDGKPVERFLKFLPIHSHKSEALTETVLTNLKELGIDIQDCRGQTYDNAANMSGKYSGLQARIRAVNPLAEFVPCSAHSLNLVGTNAVQSCSTVVRFFSLVQNIYNFFSVSTHRWQKLKEQIENDDGHFSIKSCSSTRWCADASAVKSLRKNYSSLIDVLASLSTSEEENAPTKSEAATLCKKMKKFETALNIIIWDTVLQRLNQTSIELQTTDLNLSEVGPLYQSLIDFTQTVRDNFIVYEKLAEELCGENHSYENFRKTKIPRSKDLCALNAPEVQLTAREQYISMCHYALCDSLISHLFDRKKVYEIVTEKFACLINIKCSSNLLEESAFLKKCYASDLADTFSDELVQFSSLIQEHDTLLHMLNKARKFEETFPNVETALRIFLTLPVSNCSGERSFSVLKRIKSAVRNSLLQEKLSSLALLHIESEITEKLEFDDVIHDFVNLKMRKKIYI